MDDRHGIDPDDDNLSRIRDMILNDTEISPSSLSGR